MSDGRPEISLRPVDRENFRQCVRLELGPGQEKFVAPNVYSIAQSKVEPECVPYAVYADDEMVGFLMLTLEPEDEQYWVHRFMISVDNQGRGFGRAAMETLIADLQRKPGCDEVFISWIPENVVAAKLYRDLGFVETGEIEDGEIIARLETG